MTTPLLTTKLYIPPPRPNLVERPRLVKRLDEGLSLGHRLTLVSAPAGFGKTTLLSEWVQAIGGATPPIAVAWLSLDEGDKDPTRFLAYLVAALQSVEEDLGQGLLAALQSHGAVNVEPVLTTLLNEIASLPNDLVLVLDDYHVIDSRPVDKALTFTLDHLPVNMHLVIATRSNPFLPLSRLRACGQMTDIRADDLRFSPQEIATFLNKVMGLALTGDDVATLATRTEGWIAGLQLAALSLRGVLSAPTGAKRDTTRTAQFISAFAGDDRYIADYLVDEVLARQSKDVKDFLLQTSVLDCMTGPLCGAVTGREDSQDILEQLEQGNLFIVPLDHRRQWYRYHHLFADLLRHRLEQDPALISPAVGGTTRKGEEGERVAGLHRHASIWFEDNGYILEAVKHALAGVDMIRAADLIERHAMSLVYRYQTKTVLDWFRALPDTVLSTRPMLCVFHAWALTFHEPATSHDAVEQLLRQARRALKTLNAGSDLRNLVAGHIASIRANILQLPVQSSHDPHTVLALLHEAQELLPESEVAIRSINAVNNAYEYLVLGDAAAAFAACDEALSTAQAGGNPLAIVFSIVGQALVAHYRGQLRRAVQICRRGIASFDDPDERRAQTILVIGGLFALLGLFLLERNEIVEAERALVKGIDLLQWTGDYETSALGYIALVRLRLLQGDQAGAQRAIERLARTWPASSSLAETLRMQLQLIRVPETHLPENRDGLVLAQRWAQAHRPELDDEASIIDARIPGINPWGETQHLEHLTWTQIQIAQTRLRIASRDLQPVLTYLERRLDVAEGRSLAYRVIELSVMQALALDVQGDAHRAGESLRRALTLAEPEGYVRVFIDKGEPMLRLLQQAAARGIAVDYVAELLAASGFGERRDKGVRGKTGPSAAWPPNSSAIIEPLSKREMEVLRLLKTELSGPEIARELMISLSTVRTHTKNIYGKLAVNSRRQAVARAESLNLL
jgi:LuxR family maltose regulon positive regulatory protein